MVLHALHLCSGYGGFELGLKLAGVNTRTVAHVERDSYAAATLVARMDDKTLDRAPIWSDLTTFDTEPWAGRVDIVTAGFPCQPFSVAGAKRGVDDERWLWPDIARIAAGVGPGFVFLENVPGLVRHGLPCILADLAALGFHAEWGMHSASEVGAPHKRDRFWLLAYSDGTSGEGVRHGEQEPQRGGLVGQVCDVGNAGSARRPEDSRRSPSDEATALGPRSRRSDYITGSAGEGVADRNRDGREQVGREPDHNGGPRADTDGRVNTAGFPPARFDPAWREWIAAGGPEPAVRRGPDGSTPGLADSLHLGGNGLVPRVAASAFLELSRRMAARVLWAEIEAITGRNDLTNPEVKK